MDNTEMKLFIIVSNRGEKWSRGTNLRLPLAVNWRNSRGAGRSG